MNMNMYYHCFLPANKGFETLEGMTGENESRLDDILSNPNNAKDLDSSIEISKREFIENVMKSSQTNYFDGFSNGFDEGFSKGLNDGFKNCLMDGIKKSVCALVVGISLSTLTAGGFIVLNLIIKFIKKKQLNKIK